MSKVIIIPDMHGSHNWEKAKDLAKEHPDYFVVGLGDWVDSGIYDRKIGDWRDNNNWPDQGNNLRNALSWFREDPDHRFFCIGNHDWSYLTGTREGVHVSGHQNAHALEIRHILEENKDIIYLAKEIDGWVFSHAGFTKTWEAYMYSQLHNMLDKWPDEFYHTTRFDDEDAYHKFLKEMEEKCVVWNEKEYNIDFLNKVFMGLTHDGGLKTTNLGFDNLIDWHGCFSGSGDEVMQGPLWVRPSALLRDMAYPKQVVGHTEMCLGEPISLSSKKGKVVIVDSKEHGLVTVFDTENPGKFVTEPEHNRYMKKVDKAVNTILSMKLRDEDAVRNELLNGGVKETQLEYCVNLIKEYW